jgi:hypothetical protein
MENPQYVPVDEHQAIILGAYLEDRKKWEDNLLLLEETLHSKQKEIVLTTVEKENESRIKKFFYRLFRRKTPMKKKLDELKKEIEELERKYLKTVESEPDRVQYEAAMLGNLFKPR